MKNLLDSFKKPVTKKIINIALLTSLAVAPFITACSGGGGSNGGKKPIPIVYDSDADGISDSNDNCPNVYNPDQFNYDGIGEGDACTTPIPILPGNIIFTGIHPIDGDEEIFKIKTDGSEPDEVGPDPNYPGNLTYDNANDANAQCSPDGKIIVSTTDFFGTQDLWLADSKNGDNQIPLTASADNEFGARWSPDQNQISYRTDNSLNTMNSDGTNKILLTAQLPSSDPNSTLTWLTDNNLAFENNQGQIFRIKSDGANLEQLTQGYLPKASPDRNLLAYLSDIDGQDAVYTIDPDTKNTIKLTNEKNYFDFSWFPNSEFLIGVTEEADGTNDLYRISLDGTAPKLLVEDVVPDYGSPVGLEDGSIVYITENSQGNLSLQRLHPNATLQTLPPPNQTINGLTLEDRNSYQPAWCPPSL